MHLSAWVIWSTALTALIVIFIKEFRAGSVVDTARWNCAVGILILACMIVIASQLLFVGPETMGNGNNSMPWKLTIAMFFSMILGMISQYFFFKSPRRKFRLREFVKPLLASPIILMPLLASHQSNLSNSISFGQSEMMVLLVSFQNGFFWNIVFDGVMRKKDANS